MKKYLIICALGLALVFVQGCGTDNKKTESVDTTMTIAERHAQVEKERADLAELRKAELAALIAEAKYYESPTGKMIYYMAEVNPQYVGGEKAMKKFMKENLEFPAVAEKEEMEGTVFVNFVVAQSGEVTEVKVSNHTYSDVDVLFMEEALRVVKMMPNWTPGLQNGKAVDVLFSLPITFMIG
tara:strand:- start:64 stop:612 length:549 start_codon:yes stop_codon:yes gene_type:complete